MNRHFEDAWYYQTRAAKKAKMGVTEELSPVVEKVRSATGREEEPEPTPFKRFRNRVGIVEQRAPDEAKETFTRARGRFRSYRADAPSVESKA